MEEFTAEIIDIKDETPDVKTFTLKPGVEFKSGQYCTIKIVGKEDIVKVPKPFTFSNSPTEKDTFNLTIKKVTTFTTAMFELKKGDKIKVMGPLGTLIIFDEDVKDDVVFVAGGSGVTPFISSMKFALAKGMKNHLTLFYSNRTEADVIFNEEFKEMDKNENITIVRTLTREEPEGWKGELGRVNKELVEKYVKDPEKKLWYMAGPPPMIEAMKKLLKEMGVPEEKIQVEAWQLPAKK